MWLPTLSNLRITLMKLYVELLNLGFQKKSNNIYVCEDIIIEVRNDKYYIPHLQMELTLHELEDLMRAD